MNVIAYHQAIKQGFQAQQYEYAATALPEGTYTAKLVMKVWAKSAMAISCYFDIEPTAEKVQLTVYCNAKGNVYRLDKSCVDFAICPLHASYSIQISHDKKGRLRLTAAALL